ncbi:MAG: aldehyde dehydrogenase family protein [Verrucomicrobia bacterium]|nr:aldehyde dehydrogenase family protein [Verrucomicrobiota bacterium]
MSIRTYQHWINGQNSEPAGGIRFETRNPADQREAVCSYAAGTAAEAKQAISSAQTAFPAWAAQTAVARGRVLSKASQLLETRKAEFAELLTREEGKTLVESTGEVQRAVDIFRFFGGLSYTLGGQTIPHDLPGNLLFTRREALGVVALITPWNFPIAIPVWKLAPALVCGNSVVLKPASQAPALSLEIAKLLGEAGLPKGVMNVVTGDGRSVGGELASNPAVVALSFTGSHKIGLGVHQQLAQRMARSQMEMGGKNPTIVLADADLDLAATLVFKAGFGLTGQACTATSRVVVERSVVEAFTERLLAKTRALKVGPGLQPGVDMGPAVSPGELEGNFTHIQSALREGAVLLHGGKRITEGGLEHGLFMEPTVLGGVKPSMKIAQEEVFGPVVAVMTAGDFDEAITIANGVDVGLSASLVTRDLKKAMLYAERIQAGVVKVNQISTGLALQAPFGGVKKSSTDSFKEQGAGAVEFYSKLKTVYLDYSA